MKRQGLYKYIKQSTDECDYCGKKILATNEINLGYHVECRREVEKQHNLKALEHFEELRDWINNHRSKVYLNNLKTDDSNYLLNEKITPEILATVTTIAFSYDGASNYERIYDYPESFGELKSLRGLYGQVDELPDNIGKLFNLEVIDIAGGEQPIRLPKSISQLQNLKTLKIQWGDLRGFTERLPSVEDFAYSEMEFDDGIERPVPEFITNIHYYLPNAKHIDLTQKY